MNHILSKKGFTSSVEYIFEDDIGNKLTLLEQDGRFDLDNDTEEINEYKLFKDGINYLVKYNNDGSISMKYRVSTVLGAIW